MGMGVCTAMDGGSEVPRLCCATSMKALDRRLSLGNIERSRRSGASSLFPPRFTRAPSVENPPDLDGEDIAESAASADMEINSMRDLSSLQSLELSTQGHVGLEGRCHGGIDMSGTCRSTGCATSMKALDRRLSLGNIERSGASSLFPPRFTRAPSVENPSDMEINSMRDLSSLQSLELSTQGHVGLEGMFDLARVLSDMTTRQQGTEDEGEQKLCSEGEGACHTSSAALNVADILASPCQSCGWSTEFEETRNADGGLCSTCAGTRRCPSTPRIAPSMPSCRPGSFSTKSGARISAPVPSISPSAPRMDPSTPTSRPGALSPTSSSSQVADLQLVPDCEAFKMPLSTPLSDKAYARCSRRNATAQGC